MKEAMKECGYCKEKNSKMKKYLEDLENEKITECIRALEREKIAQGMQCTKEDEIRLKEMQKMQMEEKRNIERAEEDRDAMWHQVLLVNNHRQEQEERLEAVRRNQEMIKRRRTYDEQIASANKKKQEIIRMEREKENKRLDKIMKKMNEEHFEAMKRKQDQQMKNKNNYIEGHQMKLTMMRQNKLRAKEIDDGTIRVALEELRRERERNRLQIQNLQLEKQISVEHFNRERSIVSALEEQADRIAQDWKREKENKTDDCLKRLEEEKIIKKERATKEYQRYLDNRKRELENAKQERSKRMESVKRTAFNELRNRIDSANDELKRQMEYRNSLTKQIGDNQKFMEMELTNVERKDKPFTKQPIMFKEAMANISYRNTSQNPVHPFKSNMESQKRNKSIELPLIKK